MKDKAPPASLGRIWQKYDAMERRLSASLTSRMLDLAQLRQGMRVLDLACGRGEPAIAAALRVAPDGNVIGLDIDAYVLQIAEARCRNEQITNLSLRLGSIESLERVAEQSFDVVTIRWGLMYFEDPVSTLKIIRRYLKQRGTLVIAVWANPEESSFFQVPRTALAKHAAIDPVDHNSPGTFFYDDNTRLSEHLSSADLAIQHTEDIQVDVMEAKSDAELIDWCRTFGTQRLLEGLDNEVQLLWEREIVSMTERFRHSNGNIRLGGTSRIIVAS